MPDLRQVPEVVNLWGYAGDTLSTAVKAPAQFVAGRVWTAQVRSSYASTEVDATFVVIPATAPDDLAYLYLPAADTARLVAQASAGSARFVSGGDAGQYVGVWDVQLAPAGGGDPTTTVAAGKVTIYADVTRMPS